MKFSVKPTRSSSSKLQISCSFVSWNCVLAKCRTFAWCIQSGTDLDLIHSYLCTSDILVRERILLEILMKIRSSFKILSTQDSDALVQNLRPHISSGKLTRKTNTKWEGSSQKKSISPKWLFLAPFSPIQWDPQMQNPRNFLEHPRLSAAPTSTIEQFLKKLFELVGTN